VAAVLLWSLSFTAGAAGDHHTLWSVKGRHNTVYLFGSIHVLKPGDSALPTEALQAYASAKALVMEINLNELGAEQLLGSDLELETLPEGKTLADALGPELYGKFIAHAKPLGLDPELYDHFQPWFAAVTLEELELAKLGFNANAGVDEQLAAQAAADHKEIIGLETVAEQFGLFAHLSLEQQRQYMRYSLEDSDQSAAEVDGIVTAWRHGDAPALERLLREGFSTVPDLYRLLASDRNRKWMPTIVRLLNDDQDYLVIVGALHLVGQDGLVELLKRQGYEVVQH
jgi:uncharacterized protein YbaP (TraB family)